MSTNYPGGLDSYSDFAVGEPLATKHRAGHNDLQDAVEAIEAELGIAPSGAAATVVARLNAADSAVDAVEADIVTVEADISALEAGASAVDARFRHFLAPYSIGDAEDVWWDGNDLAGFTDVVISGSHTLIESDGYLSARFTGQSADDFSGRYKARTFAIGDAFAIDLRCIAEREDYTQVGLVFSDGIVGASNGVSVGLEQNATVASFVVGRSGVLNAMTTGATPNQGHPDQDLVVKLTYVAANSFLASFGDGLSWINGSAIAKTMTPTHVGLYFCKSVSAGDSIVRFSPLCKVA